MPACASECVYTGRCGSWFVRVCVCGCVCVFVLVFVLCVGVFACVCVCGCLCGCLWVSLISLATGWRWAGRAQQGYQASCAKVQWHVLCQQAVAARRQVGDSDQELGLQQLHPRGALQAHEEGPRFEYAQFVGVTAVGVVSVVSILVVSVSHSTNRNHQLCQTGALV